MSRPARRLVRCIPPLLAVLLLAVPASAPAATGAPSTAPTNAATAAPEAAAVPAAAQDRLRPQPAEPRPMPPQDRLKPVPSDGLRERGLDQETFERLFVRSTQTAAPTDPLERIESLRVFADRELARQGRVRVEVQGEGLKDAATLRLPLGEERLADPVVFHDDGQGPDRERGDGVFTATVALDLGDFLARNLRGDAEPVEETAGELVFRGREVVRAAPRQRLREIDPRQRQRAAELRKLAPRLSRMSGEEVIRALRLTPQEPILEVVRQDGIFIERLFDLPFDLFRRITAGDVDPDRSLMIVDTGVVEDPGRTFDPCPGPSGTAGGPWTFGHLVREMAQGSGLTPEQLTLLWLHTWQMPQAANGLLVNDPARGAAIQSRVIDPWRAAGGGTFDVDRFPARLMAIVNRPDLADAVGYSAPGTAGEGRLVFGLLDLTTCQPMPFTVIFEYRVPVTGCSHLKSWHQQWKDLDAHPTGSPAYNAALEAITRQFTDHGSNPSQLPNQNALGQLRTNENALDPEWELREFTLQGPGSSTPGALGLVTVKQTPDFGLNGSLTLEAWIAANASDVLADQHVVPLRFPTLLDPFLGAESPTPFGVIWDTPGVLAMPDGADLRQKVSLATCSGCHAGETQTFFTHIGSLGRRNPGSPAALSGFLTGMSMPDPRDGSITRTFNDLALRQQALADVLNRSCFRLALEPRILPRAFVH